MSCERRQLWPHAAVCFRLATNSWRLKPARMLAAALATTVLLSACDSSVLRSWHTRHLDKEYSLARAGDIRSFADYLRLEDAVFKQLDKKIYNKMPQGPEYALQRYSPGSISDPRGHYPDWNRSFLLEPDDPRGAVLLLHGMTDSPYSLRALGQTLRQQGFWVLGLRLPGHGTAPSALTRVKWEDMSGAVRLAMAHLQGLSAGLPSHIIGYSNGAALALDYTLDPGDGGRQPDSLVLVSPAIGVSPAAVLAAWTRRLGSLPGLRRVSWHGVEEEFDPYKYNSFPVNAGEQVYRLTESVAARLLRYRETGALMPPILVLKSTVDDTVSNEAVVDKLLLRLSPQRHELVLFDVNRFVPLSPLLIEDPGPMTRSLLEDASLPFDLTLVSNRNTSSRAVSVFHKPPFTAAISDSEPLTSEWPVGVFSLSHVALPFPPEDPLYGAVPPTDRNALFLGQMPLQGERGLLKISPGFLLRLRHNPFYDYLEDRVVGWLEDAPRR